MKKRIGKFELSGYLFLIPALIIYLMFVIYPFFLTIKMPLFKIEGFRLTNEFVGLSYFRSAISDERFIIALKNNLLWSLATFAFPLSIGFVLADILARAKIKGRNFFRTIYFIPVTIAPVIIGVIFIWIYQPKWGVINTFLGAIGLDALTRGWLGDPIFALPAVIVAGIWGQIGFFMVVFLAGLQKISTELYDAAKVDGANAIQEFFFITIPGMRQELTFMSLLSLIISFKIFDIVRIMTKGGPFYRTEVLGHLIYKLAFKEVNLGDSAAVSIILTGIIFISTSLILIWREKNQD